MWNHLQELTSAHVIQVSKAILTSGHNPAVIGYANLVEGVDLNTVGERFY